MSVATLARSWRGEVLVASCVRTPLGRTKGVLRKLTAARLGAIVVDSVLQRSAVDKACVEHVLLDMKENELADTLSFSGLKETAKVSADCGFNGLSSLVSGVERVSQGSGFTICGGSSLTPSEGLEGFRDSSVSERYDSSPLQEKNSAMKFLEALKKGRFTKEIEPIRIPGHPRLKRDPITLIEDEIDTLEVDDVHIGAAVCLLSSKQLMSTIKLSPLGKVSSFVESTCGHSSVTSLLDLNKLSISDICLWQTNDLGTVKQLGIEAAQVNLHGGSPLSRISGIQDLIHLIHSLRADRKGIVLHSNGQSSLSILVEKLPVSSRFIAARKPIATLFTKDPCPLCEELKVELSPYMDRIQLEQEFLTPESYWYKLYRYEIPVLFLGGRYICRHRFDSKSFEQMLKSIIKEVVEIP